MAVPSENLNPLSLVIPSVTTTVRDSLISEVGTLVYNTTTSKLNICKTAAAGSGNWEAVTSS
tara:strand:- start:1491 stop:1676 length:186 start_codon:yes stop_codon:yes gene_type:complete